MFDKKIREVMTSPPVCMTIAGSAREAARKMAQLDIGLVVVCDEGGRAVGVVTDRDIAVRAVALGREPGECRLGEIMSRELVTCFEEDPVRDGEALMESRQVRRLVVVSEYGRPVGIVALGDIAGYDRKMTGRIMEKVAQPAPGFTGH